MTGTSLRRTVMLFSAVAFLVAAYLPWAGTTTARSLSIRALFGRFEPVAQGFGGSIAAVVVLLAVIGIVGGVTGTRPPALVAGVCGLAVAALHITWLAVRRAPADIGPADVGAGVWTCLAAAAADLLVLLAPTGRRHRRMRLPRG